MEIEIQSRNCKGCGKVYRASVSSPQTHCSTNCVKINGNKWDGQFRALSKEEQRPVKVNVSSTPPTKTSGRRVYREASYAGKSSKKNTALLLKRSDEKRTSKKPEDVSEKKRDDIENERETNSMNISEETIIQKELTTVEGKESEDIVANQIEIYEPPLELLKQEFSMSMNILTESAKQLHEQNKQILKREEFRVPSLTEVEIARNNSETIAKLIQTKINFVKALKG